MTKKGRITRIRTLYALLLGVIILFMTLFVMNVITNADPIGMAGMADQDKDYGLLITDLRRPAGQGKPLDVVNLGDSVKATVSVYSYHVSLASDSERLVTSGKAMWCMALQMFSVLVFVAMVILTVVVLISFYINVRRGKAFPKKNIRWLTWVGAMMIVVSLSLDASVWIDRQMAAELLAGTGWEPATGLSLHIGRIVFGLTIIFLAQIFYIGRDMQEEQELTI